MKVFFSAFKPDSEFEAASCGESSLSSRWARMRKNRVKEITRIAAAHFIFLLLPEEGAACLLPSTLRSNPILLSIKFLEFVRQAHRAIQSGQRDEIRSLGFDQ